MLVGSLQTTPNTTVAGAFPQPSNLTFHNYVQINAALNLPQSLLNSGIFTGGVLLCTVVFGVLAGYALAMLHFRGKGTLFFTMLLVLVVPFQLLMIPLYVLIARDYGLGDSYLGMILPFAINSTAVFIFRQYFLQLPPELFQAARIDGAGELRTLWSVALPLVRPALLTAVLLTFIGPWNEFLWPFLITKQQSKQPLAVSLANYISTVQSDHHGQPVRRHPGRRLRAGHSRGRSVPDLPTTLRLDRPRLGREGLMTVHTASPTAPLSSRRSTQHGPLRTAPARGGDDAGSDQPARGRRRAEPGQRPGCRPASCTCCRDSWPPATSPGSGWPES